MFNKETREKIREELKKPEHDYSTITVKADIHADGDVYIEGKDGDMHYIGCLGESTFGTVPDPFYTKAKKLLK